MVALDALLTERSVTRSAERLGLTQPALSASLARLRRHFHDPLLVRRGNTHELTPLATVLLYEVRNALEAADRVFEPDGSHDPGLIDREFVVLMSDYAMTIVGAALLEEMGKTAPSARLRLERFDVSTFGSVRHVLREVDGLMLPHGFIRDLPSIDVFTDRWVCVVACSNASVGNVLAPEDMRRLPWIWTYNTASVVSSPLRVLQAEGIDPTPVLTVDNFLSLPDLIADSQRIALLEERLVPRITQGRGVRVVACPYELPDLVEAFWWHPASTVRPEHRWFRAQVAAVRDSLLGDGDASDLLSVHR